MSNFVVIAFKISLSFTEELILPSFKGVESDNFSFIIKS